MSLLQTDRRSLLSVVLLVILGGSVLAAWSLVKLNQLPVARAETILRQIRTDTLSHYWNPQASALWYLVQDRNGRAVGYLVRTQGASNGGFSGLTVRRLGDVHGVESWSIDAEAAKGGYAATVGTGGLPDTEILLSEGQVTVTKPQPGGTERAVERTPGNYIPEGLTHLVIAEVAKTSAKARFCFVLNSEAIIADQLHFTSITMDPQGQGKVRVRTHSLRGASEELYHVDGKGHVFQIDDQTTGAKTRLIDLQSLARHFPEVLEVQHELERSFDESAG